LGGDKYPAAFEGHRAEEDCFLVNCLWSPANPCNFAVAFRFYDDKVYVTATVTPNQFQTQFEGVMESY